MEVEEGGRHVSAGPPGTAGAVGEQKVKVNGKRLPGTTGIVREQKREKMKGKQPPETAGAVGEQEREKVNGIRFGEGRLVLGRWRA